MDSAGQIEVCPFVYPNTARQKKMMGLLSSSFYCNSGMSHWPETECSFYELFTGYIQDYTPSLSFQGLKKGRGEKKVVVHLHNIGSWELKVLITLLILYWNEKIISKSRLLHSAWVKTNRINPIKEKFWSNDNAEFIEKYPKWFHYFSLCLILF